MDNWQRSVPFHETLCKTVFSVRKESRNIVRKRLEIGSALSCRRVVGYSGVQISIDATWISTPRDGRAGIATRPAQHSLPPEGWTCLEMSGERDGAFLKMSCLPHVEFWQFLASLSLVTIHKIKNCGGGGAEGMGSF